MSPLICHLKTPAKHIHNNKTVHVNVVVLLKISLLILSGLFISACKNTSSIETVQQQGTLKVITRIAPTTYYQDRNGPTGFEYILAQEFANELGVELEIISVDSLEDMFSALHNNQAHIAAAGLSITNERKTHLKFSSPYLKVKPQLLYRAGKKRPRTINDISQGKLLVLAHSSHAERLTQLKQQHPQITWHETDKLDTEGLLEMLDRGEIDYTIIDSNEFLVQRGFFPALRVAFDLSAPERLAWAMDKDKHKELYKSMQAFMRNSKENGTLAHLKERFYGAADQVTQIGSRTFHYNVRKKLPEYQNLIQQVAAEYNLDWRLLAAISYRESHWDPRAKSPTGVRGMMMLTQITAREMGIKNRLNAEQSLRGGARYFKKIHKRISSEIHEPDRTWFTLAAYNVGLGHVEDARKITEFQGDNPNKWVDVKQRLPLLRKKDWYAYTRHGYARGNEPVTYVQHIRHYFDLLSWGFPTDEELIAAKATENLPTKLPKEEYQQVSFDTSTLPSLSNVL